MGDTQEINKAAARRLYEEAISQGKVEVLNDIVADDARDTAAPVDGGLPSGRGGFIRHVTWLLQAVEGVKATVTDTIAEDDRVVVYWTIDGIQREEVFGVPNSGRRFTGQSISTIRFRDGKIVDYKVLPDRLGIVQQLIN
ncbi:MAG TPA: ester cyclase [Pseudonocardiaceae bacterium]